ncbi:hypothetical protein V8E51_011344 [Hyaloscypha variabilis]
MILWHRTTFRKARDLGQQPHAMPELSYLHAAAAPRGSQCRGAVHATPRGPNTPNWEEPPRSSEGDDRTVLPCSTGSAGAQLDAHHHSTPPEHQKHKHRHHRSHSSPYSPPLASPCPAPRSSASRRIPMCGMSVSSFDDAAPLGSWQPGSLGTARVSASTSTTRRVNPRIELHSTVQFSRGTVPYGVAAPPSPVAQPTPVVESPPERLLTH